MADNDAQRVVIMYAIAVLETWVAVQRKSELDESSFSGWFRTAAAPPGLTVEHQVPARTESPTR